MEIIYIDSLFFTNLLADYLLCLCAARVCALHLKRIRYFLAALWGAAYSVFVFLPGLEFLSGPGWKLLAGGAMGLIAYGGERRALGCTGVLLALSAALGGVLWALELNLGGIFLDFKLLVLCFVLSYLGLRLILGSSAALPDKAREEVEIHMLGRSCRFVAMVDSGNCLKDPLTGADVIVVCPHALKGLFGSAGALLELSDPVELIQSAAAYPELGRRLRLIPYSALNGSGMLPVFRPDWLTVGGREDKSSLVAISSAAAGRGFEGIV